jgi:3-hydroxybutyryl-CoA dehydrogenase
LRPAREDLVVGFERFLGIPANDGDRRQAKPALRALRLRIGACAVGILRTAQVSEMHSNEAERVPRLGVACAPPHRFFESQARRLGLSPARAAQPPFARTLGRGRRADCSLVVCIECLVVTMRQFERVTEFDVRRGITFGDAMRKLDDLGARRGDVARHSQNANEQPAGSDVARLLAQSRAQKGHRLGFAVLAYESPRAHCRIGSSAPAANAGEESKQKHGMPRHESSEEIRSMAQLDEVKTIGILGAGQMGGGIAQVAASSGLSVILADASLEIANQGKAKIASTLEKQVEKGKMTSDASATLLVRIKPAASVDDFRGCDFVVEAATENVDLKLALFRRCDAVLAPGKWLASNTSSISLTKLAAATSRPDRVIGMHFMNPPPLMKLVEIVRAVQTSDETYRLARSLAEKMGKTTTTSRDSPGFLVNRILIPMLCEACFALAEGAGSAEDIDAGAVLGLNHPMGPLALSDLIGLDTVLAIADVLHREMGDDKYRAPTLLRNLVAAGYCGRKSGRGFYVYDESGKRKPS